MQNTLNAVLSELNSRKHILVGFSNKSTVCAVCKQRVVYWHDPKRCGCEDPVFNFPCEHAADTFSMCPTWDPVDGCTCKDQDKHVA
jgi:hypothetical protein